MRMTGNDQLFNGCGGVMMNENAPNIPQNLTQDVCGTDDEDDTELIDDSDLNDRLSCRGGNGAVSPRSRMEQEKRMRREIANSNERRRMQSINAGFQSLKALLPRRDGEKMSKASILQQTADHIRGLQSEKLLLLQKAAEMKHLLEEAGVTGKRCHKRMSDVNTDTSVVGKHVDEHYPAATTVKMEQAPLPPPPPKKRKKFDNDSSDEGLGMMSDAETITQCHLSPCEKLHMSACATQTDCASVFEVATCTSPNVPTSPMPAWQSDVKPLENPFVQDKLWEIEMLQRQLIELRLALDRERRVRMMLEEQMKFVELNRLQSLARLQSVPLIEYGLPSGMSTEATLLTHSMVLRPGSPAVVYPTASLPPQSVSAFSASQSSNGVLEPAGRSPTSTPDSVTCSSYPATSAKLMGTHQQQQQQQQQASNAVGSSSVWMDETEAAAQQQQLLLNQQQQPVMSMHSRFQRGASRQSLEVIVEAIRHLEGDQLFVDVDCQRAATVGCMTSGQTLRQSSKHQTSSDYTDSGISSPVADRQLSTVSFGSMVNGSSSADADLNNVVAATTNALHNLCFPFPNPLSRQP